MLIEILVADVAMQFFSPDKNSALSMQWFTYYFPMVRIIDFFAGCCIGYLFKKRKYKTVNKIMFVVDETIICLIIIVSLIMYTSQKSILGAEFVRYTLLFFPTTIVLVWTVAHNCGFFKCILENRILIRIGDYSPYIFLIHLQVIKYCQSVFHKLLPIIPNVLIAVIAFLITIVLTLLWIRVQRVIIERN